VLKKGAGNRALSCLCARHGAQRHVDLKEVVAELTLKNRLPRLLSDNGPAYVSELDGTMAQRDHLAIEPQRVAVTATDWNWFLFFSLYLGVEQVLIAGKSALQNQMVFHRCGWSY